MFNRTDPGVDGILGTADDIVTNVFSGSSIFTEATSWANNFDGLLLVVVGVGIGFACVRFVKSLFF